MTAASLSTKHRILPLSGDGTAVDMLFGAAVIRGVGPVARQAGS